MQNIVYERKQNGEDFFSLPAVTYSCFGNCPANGLVTEQPQYSVIICIFSTWQNAETKLISNDLCFIFTCPLFLAQPITFHAARHTFATTVTQANNVPLQEVSAMLGHASTRMTQHYARVMDRNLKDNMNIVRSKMGL